MPGANNATTTDPREVYCGQCERTQVFREAYVAARQRV